MAKKQSIVIVNGESNSVDKETMSSEQELSFNATRDALSLKISKDLEEARAKEVAIAKLVALGLTEEDIRAVIK